MKNKCGKFNSPNHHTFLHQNNKNGAHVTVTEIENTSKVVEVKGATALQARLGREYTLICQCSTTLSQLSLCSPPKSCVPNHSLFWC